MIGVLVVDDDFMVARIHSGFIERTDGFRVVGVAHNGADALELAATLHPDLVLLDVHLPDMNGLEVLTELRARGSVAGVVMVTADRDVEVVKAALRGGAMQYLVKPFHYDDLAHRLGRVREALAELDAGEADQATIDRLFAVDARREPASLPKGLSQVTAELVLSSLRERGEQSAAECADVLGLSRVTARRYLEHFVGTGAAKVRLNYGGAGRPEHLYRPA
ncbi:MAG TPA: response regulator [Marmoricola sp.]|nr:response regulator [Marmoricola sp.]